MVIKGYKAQLKKIRVPATDLDKILSSLQTLIKAGVSKTKIDRIVQKIATDTSFRNAFLSDFKAATSKLGFKVEIEGII